jgi:hypothetical protein
MDQAVKQRMLIEALAWVDELNPCRHLDGIPTPAGTQDAELAVLIRRLVKRISLARLISVRSSTSMSLEDKIQCYRQACGGQVEGYSRRAHRDDHRIIVLSRKTAPGYGKSALELVVGNPRRLPAMRASLRTPLNSF